MEQVKLNVVSEMLLVAEEPLISINGSKYKEVKLNGNTVGYVFSNKLGTDDQGNDIFSEYSGEIRIFRITPLELGKVVVLGKSYNLIEKELEKEDKTKYKIKVLVNDAGEEVGRYSKAYIKTKKGLKFYTNRWMIRFNVYVA